MNKQQLHRVLRQAESLCQERGVKLTQQRRTVLELLCAADKPLSAYDLLDQLRETTRNPAPPTVYRALDFLLEQGFAHKLESLHAYIGCTHPDHPHASQFLICSQCGSVDEIEDEAINASLQRAEQNTGFQMRRPVIELLGTCADCSTKPSHD